MSFNQNTLMEIEEKDKVEASIVAKGFANREIQNRAYINALGVELAGKYLISQGIDTSNIKCLHSIKKILEEVDIADIILPNIHMDIRVVFDEDYIFVPKSHFEYDILPDIYLVFVLNNEFSNVNLLGYFEPKIINQNNANDEYFFIEKEKLSSPTGLKEYIENHSKEILENLSEDEMENSEHNMVSMADNDIKNEDKKHLIQQLTKSAKLRDRFIEFENFEMLSYNAVNEDILFVDSQHADVISEPMEDFSGDEETNKNAEADEQSSQDSSEENSEENFVDFDNLPSFNAEFDLNTDINGAVLPGVIAADISVSEEDNQDDDENTTPLSTEELEISEEYNEIKEEAEELSDTMSFDEVDTELPDEENLSEDLPENLMPFEDVNIEENDIVIEDLNIESLDEKFSFDDKDVNEEELTVNTDYIEDEAPVSGLDFSNVEIVEDFEDNYDVAVESLDEIDEVVEEKTEKEIKAGSFGKNLLEGLAAEDADISIETIDNIETLISEDTDDTTQTDVLSMELLSEIDDLLNSDVSNSNEDENDLDDINEKEISEDENDLDDINEKEISEDENDLDDISEKEISEDENDFDNVYEEEETFASEDMTSSEEALEIIPEMSEETDNEDAVSEDTTASEEMPEFSSEILTENDEKLGILFDEDIVNDEYLQADDETAFLENLGVIHENKPAEKLSFLKLTNTDNGKKAIIVTAALVTVIASASAFALLKPKNNNEIESIPPLAETNAIEESIPAINENNDIDTNIPAFTPQKINTPAPPSSELKTQSLSNQKPPSSESYLSVQRVMWEVPDYLSYSDKFKTYLRTAGRSIKLSLSSDLLLATEYAYTNSVKVDIKLTNRGDVSSTKIINSSGSNQIDQIVLQSVKDTLNVLKPPSSEIKSPDFNLSIIIYL